MDLDSLTLRLAQIQDELLSLPPGPSPERFRLLTERDGLRDQAAHWHLHADEQRTDEDLLNELAALRSQLRSMEDQRIDLVVQHGTAEGSGPGDGLGGVALNHKIMEGQGGSALKSRLGYIKGLLIDRGIEIPKSR